MTLGVKKFGSTCKLTEEFLKKGAWFVESCEQHRGADASESAVAKSGVVDNVLNWAKFKQDQLLKKTDGHKRSRFVSPLLFRTVPDALAPASPVSSSSKTPTTPARSSDPSAPSSSPKEIRPRRSPSRDSPSSGATTLASSPSVESSSMCARRRARRSSTMSRFRRSSRSWDCSRARCTRTSIRCAMGV